VALAILCGAGFSPRVAAEARLASSVWTLTDEQYRMAQAKITYLGEQTKPVPTVLFGVRQNLSIEAFLKAQRSATPYDNDTMPYVKTFTVSTEEFRRMLVAVRPIIADIPEQRANFLSFSVICIDNSEVCGEEFLITSELGETFYRALITGLSSDNEKAKRILISQYRNVY
jgi:hypothetical protein